MVWALIALASGAELHATLATPEGFLKEAAWPEVETTSHRWGPVTTGKVSSVWTLTAQPAVWDPLELAYRVELTSCVEWTKGKHADKHCEGGERMVRAEPSPQTWTIKGSGATHSWTLTTWYTGETPPSAMPMDP